MISTKSTARILVVDDDEPSLRALERILRQGGYDGYRGVNDSRQALPLFTQFAPDLVLLDLNMPHLDGFAVLTQLRSRVPAGTYLPVLVLTGEASRGVKTRALAGGATDFLTKPFDATEVLLRIANLLEARSLHLQLQRQNEILEERVRERTRDLDEAQTEIIERLAATAEYPDDSPGRHIQRVGRMAALVAERLGWARPEVELIRRAARLHDVGKVGIPAEVLRKPGRLTPEEFEIVKAHTTIGARLLMGSRFPLLQMAEEIALTHHERWDGSGYAGVAGEAIPLSGRITAVADVFDALLHARPYKPVWSLQEALDEIRAQSGRQFDPRVVGAFLLVVSDDTGAT